MLQFADLPQGNDLRQRLRHLHGLSQHDYTEKIVPCEHLLEVSVQLLQQL